MKILLLSNCNNINTNNIEDCKNRNEIFTFLVKSYLMKIADINDLEISVMKCFPTVNYKNLKANLFPKVDHIIYIDEKGLYDTNIYFTNYLHKFAKYTVSTICKNSKYFAGEDIMFSYIKSDILNNKIVYVKPPCDKYLYDTRKEDNTIYILFNELESPFDFIDSNLEERLYILSELKTIIENNPETQFKFASINTKLIKFIDINNNVLEVKQFTSYIDYIYELSKANIYFMTEKCQDLYRLYELSMCNTIIVTNDKYISNAIKNELDIITFKTDIDWNIIFDKINTHSIRNNMITDYSWENVINSILDNYTKYTSLYTNNISQNDLNKTHNKSLHNKFKDVAKTHVFIQPTFTNN